MWKPSFGRCYRVAVSNVSIALLWHQSRAASITNPMETILWSHPLTPRLRPMLAALLARAGHADEEEPGTRRDEAGPVFGWCTVSALGLRSWNWFGTVFSLNFFREFCFPCHSEALISVAKCVKRRLFDLLCYKSCVACLFEFCVITISHYPSLWTSEENTKNEKTPCVQRSVTIHHYEKYAQHTSISSFLALSICHYHQTCDENKETKKNCI